MRLLSIFIILFGITSLPSLAAETLSSGTKVYQQTSYIEAMIRSAVLYLIGADKAATPKLSTALPLNKIKLSDGFQIQLFAKDLPGARFMAVGAF